jgi:hypothetical protein
MNIHMTDAARQRAIAEESSGGHIEFLPQSNGIHVVLFSGNRGEFKQLGVARDLAQAQAVAAAHRNAADSGARHG